MAFKVFTSQTVQVVSIEEVTMRAGDMAFQEKEVSGAGETEGGDLDCYHVFRERSSALRQ
jgi:hypothetical protein